MTIDAVSATLRLHIPDRPQLIRVIQPAPTVTVLGRSESTHIPLPHPSVSRQHACIEQVDGVWWLNDLGSTNGVRIGGHAVQRQQLSHGDWFSLGDVYCEFVLGAGLDPALESQQLEARREASGIWLARLQDAPDRDSLLSNLLAAVVQLAECRRGFLLCGDVDQGYATVACYDIRPLQPGTREFSGSSAVIARAIHDDAAVMINDPSVLDWARGRPSIVRENLRAIIAIPISHQGKVLGVVYADSDEAGKIFSELDHAVLRTFADQAGLLLAARSLDMDLARLASWLDVDPSGQPRQVSHTPTSVFRP